MKDEYKKLDKNLKRDWIQGSNFEKLLIQNFKNYSELSWRKFLFAYCFKYYEVFHTDWLDEAFVFIEEELNNPNARNLLKEDLKEIQKEITYTKGEMSWSLSSIAEAVERLLYKEPITISCVRKIINHIWFAYSCHIEDEQNFIKKEDETLSNWIKK